jgi:hypothetical protein
MAASKTNESPESFMVVLTAALPIPFRRDRKGFLMAAMVEARAYTEL